MIFLDTRRAREKNLNFSLSFGQAAVMFYLLKTTSFTFKLMILLEDGLLGPWPIVQVFFKSYLPSKKINLFRTTAQHFFWALQELTNPTPLIFTQILLLHQRGAWISMMIRKLVKMGWLWMDFIKTTTQQHKLSQRKEIVMNSSYLSLMTMMTLMEWTSLIPLQVMKDSRLRCIYMTNCPVWKVMHQSIPSAPSPSQATEGHLSASSVPEVGHEQILHCPTGLEIKKNVWSQICD